MARNALKLSTMIGENFKICWHQIARNALKLSTMVREILKYASIKWLEMHLNYSPWFWENFEICWPQIARNALKLSTMVGENFKICWPQMAGNTLKLSTMVVENFKICWNQIDRNALKVCVDFQRLKSACERYHYYYNWDGEGNHLIVNPAYLSFSEKRARKNFTEYIVMWKLCLLCFSKMNLIDM